MSFNRIENFRESVRRVKRGKPIFILVGNRCDETRKREVSRADGANLARHYGCDFFETSAKTSQNVDRLFINIVRSLRQTQQTNDTKTKQEPRQPANKERRPCDCVIV